MKLPAFFNLIQKEHESAQQERRKLISRSNEALSLSKRAIFALHREDISASRDFLQKAENLFASNVKIFKKFPELEYEGSYKAALEENTEAVLFLNYVEKVVWKKPVGLAGEPDVFLGALSDTSGEILRYAIRQATKGNNKEVERAQEITELIVDYLIGFNLTGQLRQKFDQAKRNLRSLEQVSYDISLKR